MIVTERLELIPASLELIAAALAGDKALAAALDATVPPTWPPEGLDRAALEFARDRHPGPELVRWWFYFVVDCTSTKERKLIGCVGYKGPPSADGTVEIGYGIVSDQQRRGYASEAARGLLEHAFSVPAVHRVVAETYPDHVASLGVIRNCGFRLIGEGSEPGVIRYELQRAEYSA